MPNKSQTTRRITLDVRPGNENQALGLVEHFIKTYPDHFRKVRPERHGVGYWVTGDNSYFVYGDASHVRVKESAQRPKPPRSRNLNPLNFPNAPLRIPALALYSVRLMTVTWSVVSSLSN